MLLRVAITVSDEITEGSFFGSTNEDGADFGGKKQI